MFAFTPPQFFLNRPTSTPNKPIAVGRDDPSDLHLAESAAGKGTKVKLWEVLSIRSLLRKFQHRIRPIVAKFEASGKVVKETQVASR